MLDRIKRWWKKLPKLQRRALAVGVPVVAVAAVVNRRRQPAGETAEDVEAEADALASGLIAGGVGLGAGDLTGFVNAFGGSLADLEGRIDQLAARDPVRAPVQQTGGQTTVTTIAAPAPTATAPVLGSGTVFVATAPSGSVLRVGSRGSAVTSLQKQLAAKGFSPGPIDGIFGPKTRRAVVAFQKSAGITVDGLAGPQTMAALAGAATTTSGTISTSRAIGTAATLADPSKLRLVLTSLGAGGGRPVPQGVEAAIIPAIRPPAAASRVGSRRDRQRIAALASVRATQ